MNQYHFGALNRLEKAVNNQTGEDIIKGNVVEPFTLNQYAYCRNQPMDFVDLNGKNETRPDGHLPWLTDEEYAQYQQYTGGGVGSEGKSGGYYDIIYGDAEFFKLNIKGLNATAGSDKNGPYDKISYGEIGLNVVDMTGGIVQAGYKDLEGVWQAKYGAKVAHAGAKLGISTEYVGAKAHASALTLAADVRVIEIGDYRFYIDGTVDAFSIGIKYGLSLEEGALELGASMGAGAGLNVSWENIEDITVENEECP